MERANLVSRLGGRSGAKPVIVSTPNGNVVVNSSQKLKGQAMFTDQITLQQTVANGAATMSFTVSDACGLYVSFGINTPAGGVEFDVAGQATIANFKNFLQSFVGVIDWVNYSSDVNGVQDTAQLSNNLLFKTVSLKGDVGSYTVAVKANSRNTQFQRDLQTVYPNGEFAWTTQTSLSVATIAPPNVGEVRTVQITFKFKEWISYEDYMNRADNNLHVGM